MKSRCMSMTTSAVLGTSKAYAYGRAAISGTTRPQPSVAAWWPAMAEPITAMSAAPMGVA